MVEQVGATYHISEGDADGASYDYAPLQDGETFRFGNLDLIVRSVATPGHTPGSTSLEVAGRFLMTGDAVFVSGIGRPDLGGQTEPWRATSSTPSMKSWRFSTMTSRSALLTTPPARSRTPMARSAADSAICSSTTPWYP